MAVARAGDGDAWRELFDAYYPRLYRFMRARVSDEQTAQDLAAETFVDAFRGLPRFRWQGRPFGAWLFRVGHNRLRQHYRSSRNSALSSTELLDHHAAAPDDTLAVELADVLSRLPADYRDAIQLRYVLGLSGEEAAAAMGRSHGAFRMLLHRATAAFREEYGEGSEKGSAARVTSPGLDAFPLVNRMPIQAEGEDRR